MNDRSPNPSEQLEARTREIGRKLLDASRRNQPRATSRSGQEERMLNRLMADERARVQMLRFVDVLPALRDDDGELVRHLEEYLGDVALTLPLPVLDKLPGLVNWTVKHARSGVASHVLAAAVRATSHRLAKRFIAGNDADSAVKSLRRLYRAGMGFTLDLLGEATVSEAEAEQYQARYLSLLDELAPRVADWPENPLLDTINGRTSPRLNLSIKVTALFSQLDPLDETACVERIKERLRPIARRARQVGAFVTLDMEQYDTKRITFRVFRELFSEAEFADWPDVGLAVQAYLRDAEDDVDALITWAQRRGTPITVRIVRGAYWDFETVSAEQHGWRVPVWTRKQDTDRCYETCLHKLFDAHPHIETAAGTHNIRSLALALALAEGRDLDPTQYELQMLYGMADPVKAALVEMGQRMRVYAPFGELLPGMAYLVRRLLENTSSQSFLRMGFSEDADPATVLASPFPRRGVEPILEAAKAREQAVEAGGRADETESDLPDYEHEVVHRFTEPHQWNALAEALNDVRTQLGAEYPLRIGGEERRTRETLVSVNPARPEQVVGRCGAATDLDAQAAVEAAAEALPAWSSRSFRARADILLNATELMRQRRDELAAWEVFEAGKPWREADADVVEAIDFLTYYAREAVRLGKGHTLDAPGELNHYHYRSRGVAAIIAPWNFPLAIITGMTAAALVTGNTAVVKPAPQSPVIAAKMVDILTDAGVPDGAINFLPGGDAPGKALVAHPDVAVIAFTGSMAAGCAIYAEAAQVKPGQSHLKRVIAEMGGKNAIIVDDDADLDDAVRGAVRSAFGYAGQKCSACSRLIAVGGIHGPLVERLVEAARSMCIGPAESRSTFVPPVIDAEARDRIRGAIEKGKREAEVAYQADVSALVAQSGGYYIPPTIFTNVSPGGYLAQEEIFGPVLAVLQADSFDHALELANNTRYALTGGVYSRSPAHLHRAEKRFAVGNLYLNRSITGAIVNRQPFGGFKMSGVGSKAGGPDYLLQFVEPRTVTENIIRRGFAPDIELAEQMEEQEDDA